MKTKSMLDASEDYLSTPQDKGFFEGNWFYEETIKALRLGFKVRKKLYEESSAFQKINVYDTAFFGRVLVLDGLVMLTERDEFIYHEMISHVPLCSIPEPKTVLIIGGGDCGTMREVLKHPSVEKVVQVEIDERVTRVSEKFFPWVRSTICDERVEMIFGDGIEYVQKTGAKYDLLVIDSTDPVGPALGLFVRDFYRMAARILSSNGVMVAQTESPYADPTSVHRIYTELRSVFEHVSAYHATVPTYPIGQWTWCYASPNRTPGCFFDMERAAQIESTCLYYNTGIQTAAFQLPNFMKLILNGQNPFLRFDEEYLKEIGEEST